jgi:hypothetical protein
LEESYPSWPKAGTSSRKPISDSNDSWPGLGYEGRMRRIREIHRKVVPDHSFASAAVAVLVSGNLAIGFTYLAVQQLQNYGWGLFVGMPFCLGLGSVLLFGIQRPQRFAACIAVASLSLIFYGGCMMILAFEGAICLLMAAPLGFPIVAMGGAIGYVLQLRPWIEDQAGGILLALVLTLPALTAAEWVADLQPPLVAVRTEIEIDVPPEQVWQSVIAFPPLDEPDEWLFRAGIAYPTEAHIEGDPGHGAVRHCVFSTGTFVEPIEIWDEPRLLQFSVTDQPPPMRELSLYDIHPPHLDHYLVSQKGQFLLTPLPGGRTRLEGTTWYINKMWPEAYWQIWSDYIIHKIHGRVLRHIRGLAEQARSK